MKSKFFLHGLVTAGALLLTGCNYDVPLTAKPTRQIAPRVLGDWIAKDGNKEMHLSVRKLDEFTYIVALDGDLYQAFHSDFADTPFVSVQNLQPGADNRKYIYYAWEVSADGEQLSLKGVSTELVPANTKGRAALQKLIKQYIDNPKLFGEESLFTRKKPR